MKSILEKYKSVLMYLFFGVCTTGINVASYGSLKVVLLINKFYLMRFLHFLELDFFLG